MSRELIKYNAMCTAIEAACAIDEVKDIRDKSIALEKYAHQAKNTEAERQCREIRIRAERKAGELTGKMEKASPGPPKKGYDAAGGVTSPKEKTLAGLGVTRQEASEWERLSKVPKDKFEKEIKMPLPSARKIANGNRNPVWERLSKLPKDKEPLPPKVKRKSRYAEPMNIVVGGEIVGVLNPEQAPTFVKADDAWNNMDAHTRDL